MKKIIPVVALASALGVAGLASCKPEIKEVIKEVVVEKEVPVEVPVDVHHHHYGITVEAKEGITTEVPTIAETGTDVTVKATAAEGSEFEITGIEAGEGVEVKAGEAGTWTFKMPERPVTLKVNTSDILYPVTVTDADAAKGTMAIVDPNGAPVESAPAGTELIAKYTGTDTSVREGNVKLGEKELTFDGTAGGYKFTVPSGGATITYELVEAVYRVSYSSNVVSTEEGEGIQFVLAASSQTQDYEDYKDETPTNGQFTISPGRLVDLTLNPDTEATLRIIDIKLNGESIEFMEPTWAGSPYTCTFTMPTGDAVLEFVTEEIPTVNVSYILGEGIEVYVDGGWDETTGDSLRLPAPTKAKVGGTYAALGVVTDLNKGIDPTISGVYLADGTKVEGGMDITGNQVTIYGPEEITADFQVRLFSAETFDLNGSTGTWSARKTYGKNLGETSIQIQSDGSFTFISNDTSISNAKYVSGNLTVSEEGSYHWDNAPTEAPTATEETKVSSIDIWPAYAEDGSIRWLNTRYYDAAANSTSEMYLTQGLRGEIYNREFEAKSREGEVLRYFQNGQLQTEGGWVKSTPEKMEIVEVSYKDADGKKVELTGKTLENIDRNTIVEEKVGFKTEYFKHTGWGTLVYAKAERGIYKIKGGSFTDPKVEIDGFGGYKYDKETGTYTYDEMNKVFKLTSSEKVEKSFTNVSKYVKELEAREAGVKDALSGLTYAIPSNGFDYPKSLIFTDRDTVSIEIADKVAYQYNAETKTATVRFWKGEKTNDLVFKLNDDLSIEVVSGTFHNSDDLTGKKFETTTLQTTLTDSTSAGEPLVLTGGEAPKATMGATTESYSLERDTEGLKVVFNGNKYLVDLTAKTYTKLKADITWVNAANATYKMANTKFGTTDGGWNDAKANGGFADIGGKQLFTNIDLKFSADGSKIESLTVTNYKIVKETDWYSGDENDALSKVGSNSWTNLEYVIDDTELTLTIKLNDAEGVGQVMVFDINANEHAIVARAGMYERTSSAQTVGLGDGLKVLLQ